MRELRRQSSFAPERAHSLVVARDGRMQCLERDFALERQVPRAPNGSERAGSQLGENLIVIAEGPSHARFRRIAGDPLRLTSDYCHRTQRISALDRA